MFPPNGPKMDPKLQQMLTQQQMKSMQVRPEDVVVCANCESEFFVSAIRLAKSKIDLRNVAVGLIHERPFAFCAHCKTRLPDDINDIKTKRDLTAGVLDVQENKEEGNQENNSQIGGNNSGIIGG